MNLLQYVVLLLFMKTNSKCCFPMKYFRPLNIHCLDEKDYHNELVITKNKYDGKDNRFPDSPKNDSNHIKNQLKKYTILKLLQSDRISNHNKLEIIDNSHIFENKWIFDLDSDSLWQDFLYVFDV